MIPEYFCDRGCVLGLCVGRGAFSLSFSGAGAGSSVSILGFAVDSVEESKRGSCAPLEAEGGRAHVRACQRVCASRKASCVD